jgi:hypothetical protein
VIVPRPDDTERRQMVDGKWKMLDVRLERAEVGGELPRKNAKSAEPNSYRLPDPAPELHMFLYTPRKMTWRFF